MHAVRFIHRAMAIIGLATLPVLGLGVAAHADEAPAESSADALPGRLMVRYRASATPEQKAVAESQAGARLTDTIDALNVHVLSVDPERSQQSMQALARNPHVEYVEQDGAAHAFAVTPNDPYWSQQWGAVKTATNTAWQTTTGASVVVAVLDTGVDMTHPDLKGAFTTSGYDFVNRDRDATDDNGHGTSVSGVIAARGNNGAGVAGECWSCVIMPVKVLSSSGSGSWSTVASGITYAADNGARIINMSLGGSSSSTVLSDAVNYAANKGVLIVAAAGNAGTTTVNYPAGYPAVFSVAASDSRDARYSWSTYGSWVDVAAPGCNITTSRGGSYGTPCGTSFSSPMVAGVAALLASANPSASSATIKNTLRSTADNVGTWVSTGRVNAGRAMSAMGSAPAPAPTPEPTPAPGMVKDTFSGALSKRNTSQSYAMTTNGGSFDAVLTFTRTSSLAVSVLDASGSVVGSASGASPVRLSGTLPPGTYSFVVGTASRASFTLEVTYA